MLRTNRLPVEYPHPDTARIAGISAAIAFNAALLMLLMRPMELAYQNTRAEDPPIQWVDPVKPKPVEVVPVQKPHPIVAQQQTTPQTQPQRQPQVITQSQTPMSTDYVITPPRLDVQPPQIIDTGNLAPIEASLAYRDAPPPPYPRDALREGIEGTVQLRVLVDETGHVLDVQIQRSSGERQLDNAAREHVLHRWLFVPAQRNGVAMRAWGVVPIVFRVEDR